MADSNIKHSEPGIIVAEEMDLCRYCLSYAKSNGASAIRISLSKSIQNSICVLDGEVDRISYSEDRSIFIHMFAGGRYGTFSTNKLDKENIESFIDQALSTTLLMAPDACRKLPDIQHKVQNCERGDELDLVDPAYYDIPQEKKIASAMASSGYTGGEYTIESLECEYSDSLDDNFMVDSDGFEGRHTETSFGFCAEATVSDTQGNKYSGYQWTAVPKWQDFHPEDIASQAIEEAAAQIGPRPIHPGKKTVIVHAKAASRLIGPIIQSLDGNAIQQKFSFLDGSLDTKVFPESLTIYDNATEAGKAGSRLFDTEGCQVTDGPIIEAGVVKKYFVNTYCSAKTGFKPTVEGPSRPCIKAFICNSAKKDINLTDIMAECGNGLLITGFNGGNCNQATGAFSFGIEGFVFENGKISYPFEEALMTGNMIELWNKLRAAGSDARPCARWQIPSLAFDDIDINA